MKNIYRIFFTAMAALLVLSSCSDKSSNEPEPQPGQEVQPETRTLTFVLPDCPKTAWEAGDQIIVHGEYAKNQVTVTLSASDISSDGKSATKSVSGLYPYKREDCSSTLYASYPASAVDNLKHCFFYSKFSTTNEMLMAACNDSGDNFNFHTICGTLAISVGEGYDGYLLSTPKKEAVGYEFLQVKITDAEQLYSQYVGSPVLEVEGTPDGGNILVHIPGGASLSGGFTLKLRQDGEFTKIYKYTNPVDISRGEVIDLGDVSDEVMDYDNPFSSDIRDLDAGGNANCYIVTEPGGYKFKAVKGNNAVAFFEDAYDAVVLWETWNDLSEVTEGSVVTTASFAEDYIIIHTPETLHPGNAVVALRDADGVILWSWHIWIPATEIVTASFGGIMGNDLMDRNLGALVAAEAAESVISPLSYGLVYQWGRKDPFTASGGTVGDNTLATWAGASDEVAPGQITLEQSVANPRLLGHINNGDWLVAPDNTLWTDTDKTVYDPCPPGYRVPPMNTSVPFWAGISTQAGWSVNSTYGWITIGVPATVLPIAGYRDDYSVGSMAKVGARTLYWTAKNSTDAAGSGNDLRPDGGTYSLRGAPKARLGSVRCVLE